jgi:HD-like signal output (HDOD) protein
LDHLVAQVKTLPTPPVLFAELEAALNNPDISAEEVGRILERDVSMSAKILQLCNSAFFGFREHVTRPRHAVALLGVSLVRSLTLAFHAFTKWTNKVPRFDHNALLAHSLNVAAASQNIAEAQGVPEKIREEFFIAGLLHDIGKLVLAANASETYNNVFEIAASEARPFVDVERDLLGATHAEAGAYLLGLWGFGDGIVMATAYHHLPSSCPNKETVLLAAVHVANAFDHQRAGEDRAVDLDFLRHLHLADRLDAWRALDSATAPPLPSHPHPA